MMASAVAMLYEFNYYNGDHLLEKMNIPVVELLKVRYELLHYCLCRSGHLFAGKISVVECKNPNMSLKKLSTRGHPHFSILTTNDMWYGEGQK